MTVLKADTDLIDQALRTENRGLGAHFLKIVADDLQVKADNIRFSGGWEMRSKAVVTKASGKVTDGYSITCVPRALYDKPQFYLPFDKQSSPATKDLGPGVYLIWATRGDVKTPPERMDVGAAPGPEPVREIAVP